MATPLRDLLTSLAFDDGARAAYADDPGQYLADHGWDELDGTDLAAATTALTAELPVERAVALYEATPSGATGTTGTDYLGELLASLDPSLAELDPGLDDPGIGLDDPAEVLDTPGHDPGLGVDRAHEGEEDLHDDSIDGDLHLDFGLDVDLPDDTAAVTSADPVIDPLTDPTADAADPFGPARDATFDGWSDPAGLDATFDGESDLFPDDPHGDLPGFDPGPGATDDHPDL